MPAPTPPCFPLLSAENHQSRTCIPISTQHKHETPKRDPVDATCSVPLVRGPPIQQDQKPDVDRFEEYASNYHGYKPSTCEDFNYNGVFINVEHFMEHVLLVPNNWETRWGPMIEQIKTDESFQFHYERYINNCKASSPEDESFYEPFVSMVNAMIQDPCEAPGKTNLSPHTNTARTRPIQLLEVKPFHGKPIDGWYMPKLGRYPSLQKRRPSMKSKYLNKKPPKSRTTARKRPADESHRPQRKVQKRHHESTPGGENSPVEDGLDPEDSNPHRDAYVQIENHFLEQFSLPALRSHATVALLNRDCIQFFHANHSTILVASEINFGENDETGGLDTLIAIVFAFVRLSLTNNGILHDPRDDRLSREKGYPSTRDIDPGDMRVREGRKLVFGGDGKSGPFTLTYGGIIHRELMSVGRSTTVVHATSPKWNGVDLVLKIYWPDSDMANEGEFLQRAIKEAEDSTDKWALKHLPGYLFNQDVTLGSIHGRVASCFDGNRFDFIDRRGPYVERHQRVIIQERLYPLTTLTDVRDIAQVLVDIACIHRWLYEKVGILHQDLSLANIMYRIIEGKVYGVLTDFDLSSWTAGGHTRDARAPPQLIGTATYMACDLLYENGFKTTRLYRHDLESLFYVMVSLATYFEVETPGEGKKGGILTRKGGHWGPQWFYLPSYRDNAFSKHSFLSATDHIELSPTFKDFRDWLEGIRSLFREGMRAKDVHEGSRAEERWNRRSGGGPIPEFDDETLGGRVCYSKFIDSVRNLKGRLEGLVVRYEPEAASLDGNAS